MQVEEFKQKLATSGVRKNDRVWFPRWWQRFATFAPAEASTSGFSRECVIQFLQSLRDTGVLAWRRRQAVEAICAFRDLVLRQSDPDLADVRGKLIEIEARERATGVPNGGVQTQEDRKRVIGHIDCDEPGAIQKTRAKLRVMHYSFETERAYVGWIFRFMDFCGTRDVSRCGENP